MFKHIIDVDLELKLINLKDSEEFYRLIDSNRIYLRKWLGWVDDTKSSKDIESFIKSCMNQYANNGEFQASIWYKGVIVGIIGLYDLNMHNKSTSIGYWLAENYQGSGIMTRACKAIIDYVFKDLELQRVEIRCADKNFKSQAIPKRLGFTEEGVCRKSENLYGNFVDLIVYSILKEEWI
ncbi:GNAT family N-acetyltransferase [Sedimentibacter sp. zth1]|uniref:GNAT family N-acetyltransferase n=1 Tax=Sedimentibacter sp. zth1 TaxID=2816908 RepID=UPI001A91B8A9|nr:GNAT family protein [Sedimentibacter sp. zth1]QSX06680.1 GNAT family N-acetyltransferase [Sedimentibacter sp. zth1]